ncbi:MAG: hypothetical protein ACFFAO_21390 [Candidatus Hermodarchaeota archaeon]
MNENNSERYENEIEILDIKDSLSLEPIKSFILYQEELKSIEQQKSLENQHFLEESVKFEPIYDKSELEIEEHFWPIYDAEDSYDE